MAATSMTPTTNNSISMARVVGYNVTKKMLARIQKVQLEIKEPSTQQALEDERAELVKAETESEAWLQRCEKWLTDVAFVNDVPEPRCDPLPLGLRPGETIGPTRKRRRTVGYVPVEHVTESAEEEESEWESESAEEDDSDYSPSDDE